MERWREFWTDDALSRTDVKEVVDEKNRIERTVQEPTRNEGFDLCLDLCLFSSSSQTARRNL